jgi:hypothetical protein
MAMDGPDWRPVRVSKKSRTVELRAATRRDVDRGEVVLVAGGHRGLQAGFGHQCVQQRVPGGAGIGEAVGLDCEDGGEVAIPIRHGVGFGHEAAHVGPQGRVPRGAGLVVGSALLDDGERTSDQGDDQRESDAGEQAPESAELRDVLALPLLLAGTAGGEELVLERAERWFS